MFIILGTRTLKDVVGTTREMFHCDHCNNDNHYKVTKVRRFFALFFIPLIPFSKKYFVHCPVCDYGVEMEEESAEKLMK